MFGFNQGSEVVYQCSTRLTAGSGIGVGAFIALKYYLDYYYYSRWLKNNG